MSPGDNEGNFGVALRDSELFRNLLSVTIDYIDYVTGI
jgi:hypothetical protein